MEMYLAGVSVRRVEDITEALWGMQVSAGTVSDLNKKMYERIDKWRNHTYDMSKNSISYRRQYEANFVYRRGFLC